MSFSQGLLSHTRTWKLKNRAPKIWNVNVSNKIMKKVFRFLVPYFYLLPAFAIIFLFGFFPMLYAFRVFFIFLLRQHFKTIPKDLYDAAVMDGCSRLGFLIRVVLPLSKAVLVTVSLFSIVGSWNSFIWPLVVTSRDALRPIQVGLAYFIQEQSTNYTLLTAAAVFSIAPIVLLFIILEKKISSSFAKSGLKG